MTNAELISRVRSIAKHGADWRINEILNRAADELEAAEKRIKELEARTPKWTMLKDEMPKPHTKVLVSGIEAINNTRVYKVMVNDNGTLRPTDYAPSIMWDCWMPFGSPNCGARMQTVTKCHTLWRANDE